MYSVHDGVGLLVTASWHRYCSLESFLLFGRSFGSLLAEKNRYFLNRVCEGAGLQKMQFPDQEFCKHEDSALSIRIRILQPPAFLLPL